MILHYQDVSDAANGSKAVILFGADEAVSKQLRTDFLAIFAQPGKPFRIEGALLSFQSSTWDGSSWFSVDQADDVFLPISPRDLPSEELDEQRFLGKKYEYFLVTRLFKPDENG